jgi:hypothetical protein
MTSLKSPSEDEFKKLCEEVLADEADAAFAPATTVRAAAAERLEEAAPILARAYLAATKRLEEVDGALVDIVDKVTEYFNRPAVAKLGCAMSIGPKSAEIVEAARSRLARQQGEQR